jgi:hypothetical protein
MLPIHKILPINHLIGELFLFICYQLSDQLVPLHYITLIDVDLRILRMNGTLLCKIGLTVYTVGNKVLKAIANSVTPM